MVIPAPPVVRTGARTTGQSAYLCSTQPRASHQPPQKIVYLITDRPGNRP